MYRKDIDYVPSFNPFDTLCKALIMANPPNYPTPAHIYYRWHIEIYILHGGWHRPLKCCQSCCYSNPFKVLVGIFETRMLLNIKKGTKKKVSALTLRLGPRWHIRNQSTLNDFKTSYLIRRDFGNFSFRKFSFGLPNNWAATLIFVEPNRSHDIPWRALNLKWG